MMYKYIFIAVICYIMGYCFRENNDYMDRLSGVNKELKVLKEMANEVKSHNHEIFRSCPFCTAETDLRKSPYCECCGENIIKKNKQKNDGTE